MEIVLRLRIRRLVQRLFGGSAKLAELFALLTGTLFVLSAGVNTVWMRLALDVDYFSVATPIDVVMNGVSALGFATITVAAALMATLSIEWVRLTKQYRDIMRYRRNPHSPAKFYLKKLRRDIDHFDHSVRVLLLACAPLVLLGAIIYISKPPNLQIMAAEGLPVACAGKNVAWLGSQAIAIRCNGDVHVLRDTEHVHMVRLNRHCEFGGLRIFRCERRPSTSTVPQASPSPAPVVTKAPLPAARDPH